MCAGGRPRVLITLRSFTKVRIKERRRQYNTIQCNAMQCNTIRYNTMQYNTIQYDTIRYDTIEYNKRLGVVL